MDTDTFENNRKPQLAASAGSHFPQTPPLTTMQENRANHLSFPWWPSDPSGYSGVMPRLDPPIENATVMAERMYEVEGLNSKKTLVIRIGFPAKKVDANGDYFECQAEIGDGVDRIVRHMGGRDAFEAIFVAVKMIGVN